MNVIIIWEPRYRDSVVLIAERKIMDHNEVAITHKNKAGIRTYPKPFYLAGAVAKRYPLEQMPTKAGGTIAVRAIPLHVIEKEEIA